MFLATILFLALASWVAAFYLGRLYLNSDGYKKWAKQHAEQMAYKTAIKNCANFKTHSVEYYAAYMAEQETLRKAAVPQPVYELKTWSDFDGKGWR